MGSSVLKLASDDLVGGVRCTSTVYATALAGTGSLGAYTTAEVGQKLVGSDYTISQAFHQIDMTPLPAGATVTAATIQVEIDSDNSGTNFDLTSYTYDFDVTIGTTDFRTDTELAALTSTGTWPKASAATPTSRSHGM